MAENISGIAYDKRSTLGMKKYVDQADGQLQGQITTLETQIGAAFFFKGSSTYAELPSSGNTVNDTYYVTDNDKQCWYTWNGTDWVQSSMNQASYDGLIEQLKKDMSNLYDNTATYQVGDYCINDNDNKLYVCKTAIAVPESFDSAHWQAVAFSDAFGDMILVQNEQPTTAANKIWFSENNVPDGVEVPTMDDIENIVAEEYDNTHTYAAGQYCIHDNLLYRCTTATELNEAWTSSHWTQIDVAGEIGNLKTEMSGITGVNTISFTNGSYIKTNGSVGSIVDLTPVAGSERNNYAIVSGIASGQKFTINGTGGSTGRLWAFVDENDILLSNAKASANATNLVLTAPDGADKLILNPIDNVLLCTIGEIPKLSIDLLQEHENYENTVIKLQNSDFINGRWQNRQIESVDNRICIYQMIHVRKGDSIIVTQNDLLIYISEYIGTASTAATVLKAFENVAADGTVIRIAEEGDVLIMLKDSGEADITPSDYDADITVITYTPALYSDFTALDAYKRNGYMDITANDLINGYFLFRSIAANAKSLCYTRLIPVRAGDRIAYKTGTLEFYAGLYPEGSSTIEEIVAWNSAESEKQYIIQADGMLAIRIRNASVTNISPSDFTGYIRITNDFVSRRDSTDQIYAAEYYGEPIKRHGYNYQEIITIAPGSGNTPNDIAVYNDYIFVGINIQSSTEGIIKVFNKNTHEAVTTFTVEGGDHFNLLQFSDEKYDESDLFPLLVINTQKAAPNDGLYLVLRIASDLSGCTVVKKYQFKATDFYLYPQVYFDFENSLAYAICLSDTTAAKYIFYKIDLTAGTFDSETNTTVYSSVDGGIILQSEIENPGVRQGGQIFEDKIYLMRCDRNSNRYDNAKVYVINKNGINPVIETVVPLATPFGRTAEGEGVSMVIENEKPVMYASTTAKIYRIEF